MTEAQAEAWAREAPGRLLRSLWVGQLDRVDLALAARAVALVPLDWSPVCVTALVPLLDHSAAVVRECACLGLAPHLDDLARSLLRRLAAQDPSRAVRTIARDVLEA